MPKVSKYYPLEVFLKNVDAKEITMSFDDIEIVIEKPLPASAYKHRAFWGNEVSGTHRISLAWMNASFLVVEVNIIEEKIVFRKRESL